MTGIITNTCKVGQGAACCRYLTMGSRGWVCCKTNRSLKRAVDQRASSMKAKGDNCAGVRDLANFDINQMLGHWVSELEPEVVNTFPGVPAGLTVQGHSAKSIYVDLLGPTRRDAR
jgi:hypothetical protein